MSNRVRAGVGENCYTGCLAQLQRTVIAGHSWMSNRVTENRYHCSREPLSLFTAGVGETYYRGFSHTVIENRYHC